MNQTSKGLKDRLREAISTEEVELLLQEAESKKDASIRTRKSWIKTAQQVLNAISRKRIEKAKK